MAPTLHFSFSMRETLFITGFFGAMLAGFFLFKPSKQLPMVTPAPVVSTVDSSKVKKPTPTLAQKEMGTEDDSVELPTIYSRPNKKSQKKKSSHFSTADYIESKKSEVAFREPTAPTDENLRVYLWCMEVKKDALAYSGEKKCAQMLDSVTDKKISTQLFRSNM